MTESAALTAEKKKVIPTEIIYPFVLVTSLFALWGFANDITNPMLAAFKTIMLTSHFESSLVQFAFYGGYCVMAIPAALFIKRFTYKSGILVGVCRGVRKVGFSPAREQAHVFLNEKVPYEQAPRYAMERYLHLVASLGCSCAPPSFLVAIRQHHRNNVLRFLTKNGIRHDHPIVVLHPGTRWETKRWGGEKWAALGDLLYERDGAQVIFTGSQADVPVVKRITEGMKFSGVNAVGKTKICSDHQWIFDSASIFHKADISTILLPYYQILNSLS